MGLIDVRNRPKSFNMGRFSVSTMALVLAVLFGGSCSSTETGQNTSANRSIAKPDSANSGVEAVTTPAGNADAENIGPSNVNSQTPMNRVMQRIEQARTEAANKPMPSDSGKNARPAPEDSTITIQLTDVARETRVFNKHPVLLRVEKIHDGKDGAVKIVFRDGRTFDRPGKSITRLDQITTIEILRIAGVATPEPRSDAPVANPLKKPEQ